MKVELIKNQETNLYNIVINGELSGTSLTSELIEDLEKIYPERKAALDSVVDSCYQDIKININEDEFKIEFEKVLIDSLK